MTQYRRVFEEGGCYFFTVVTEGRRPLSIEHIGLLREAFRHGKEGHPFAIDAIVVLPDHLHTVWRLPPGDDDFSLRWMVIKRKFSAGFDGVAVNTSKQAKREKGIWQRRFWEHCIRDERDWRAHLDYIHYNPVKHGYCGSPADWPYSSFGRAVAQGWYERDWGISVPRNVVEMEWEWLMGVDGLRFRMMDFAAELSAGRSCVMSCAMECS